MKEIDEYIVLLDLPILGIDADHSCTPKIIKSVKTVLRQLTEDVREECWKACFNVPERFKQPEDILKRVAHAKGIGDCVGAIRNLKLFEGEK